MGKPFNQLEPLTLDPNREIPKYSVFDVESNDWKDLVVVGHYDGTTFRDFSTILEMLDFLEQDGEDKVIFAHNGGAYDFSFVLQEIVKGKGRKKWQIDKMIARGGTLLLLQISSKGKKSITIQFRDSLAILPFSLKSLTDSFKTEAAKGEWDHEKRRKTRHDPDLLAYLRDDCIGLYQVIWKFSNWPMVKGSGVAFTIASQALKIFRTFLNEPIPSLTEKVDQFVRKGYFGGRTEIFRPYFKSDGKSKISTYDVNSLYPSVMRDFEFPTRFKFWTYKYLPKEFGFYEATVYVPKDMYVPPLGVMLKIDPKTKKAVTSDSNKEGKFMFPTGTFSGVWSTAELEYARSLGVKILKTGRGAIFENGGYIFKDFVEHFWEMRKSAVKDSVDSFICKLILNSSYGRFGLNLDRENLTLDDGASDKTPSIYEFETEDLDENGNPIYVRFAKEKKRISSFTNVAIAAYVTAYARIRMHKEYLKVWKELYYTDTDSAMLEEKGKIESSKELGKFKYEYSASEGCFLLPKTYALAGITGLKDAKGDWIKAKKVAKGIDRESLKSSKVDLSDFLELLDGEFKRLAKFPLSPLTFGVRAKFAKLKSAMRKGTFLYVKPGQEKEIKAKYDKREIFLKKDGSYDSRPIFIEDGLATNYQGTKWSVMVEKKKGKKKVTLLQEKD